MKHMALKQILLFILLLGMACAVVPAWALTANDLPEGAALNTDVAAPSFQMEGPGGTTISSGELNGKAAVLVFGRITCPNTRRFLEGLRQVLPLLQENGVSFLVGLSDNPTDEEVRIFSDEFGSCRCGKISDYVDNGMWNGLEAIGYDIFSGVTFPVVFIRDKQNHLRYYSTGPYTDQDQILSVASAALALAGVEIEKPEVLPELQLTVEPSSLSIGGRAVINYKVSNPDPNGQTLLRIEVIADHDMHKTVHESILSDPGKPEGQFEYTVTEPYARQVLATLEHYSGGEVLVRSEAYADVENQASIPMNFEVADPDALYAPGDTCSFSSTVSGTKEFGQAEIHWEARLVNFNGDKNNEKGWSIRQIGERDVRDVPGGSQTYWLPIPDDARSDEVIRTTFTFTCGGWTRTIVKESAVRGGPDKIRAFVTRCYQLILNREPDEGGLQGWCEALRNKKAAASNIIDSFMRSDEYTNRKVSDGESVEILYKAMLNRSADESGKAGWVDALGKGYTLQHIINGFCASDEFTALCKDFGIEPGTVSVNPVNPEPAPDTPRGKIEAFVKRCYKLILNRDADQGGLKGWSDALETGVGQACQIIDGFVRSPEYVNRNLNNAESVDILYQTMLNRAADEGGKAGWVDALENGYTLQHIINGFCGSAEFTNICNEFGITAGNLLVQGVIVKREAIAPEGEEEAPVVYINYASEYTNEEKVRAFVEHCYEAVFGREGDAEDIEAWTQLILDGKKTPKRAAYELIFSEEFRNNLPGNEAFIRILYKLYLNREPNAEELAGWIAMLENGADLEEIVNGFAASTEFKVIVNEMKV